jgi:hypothetical protein
MKKIFFIQILLMLIFVANSNAQDSIQSRRPQEIQVDSALQLQIDEFLKTNGPTSLLYFTKCEINHKEIPMGPVHEFLLDCKNVGNMPAIINKSQPSCGCMVPKLVKNEIKPGESFRLEVDYHTSGRFGPMNKSITIFSNGFIFCGTDFAGIESGDNKKGKKIMLKCIVMDFLDEKKENDNK